MFFNADDGTHGWELWTSGGTEAGTVLVKDIHPDDGYYYAPTSLTGVGESLFFRGWDSAHGWELWTSDGTEAGTVLVKDIDPDHDSYGGPSYLTDVGGTLFFSADDGTHDEELWTSDGTEVGTVLVKDINVGGGFTVASTGTADTDTGTMRVKVNVRGAGRLVVRPADGSPVRRSVQEVGSAGKTTITLRPTKAGMRKLKRALRQAHREGRQVGKLQVRARFTFTPCGETGSSVTRQYTLRLR